MYQNLLDELNALAMAINNTLIYSVLIKTTNQILSISLIKKRQPFQTALQFADLCCCAFYIKLTRNGTIGEI